MFRDGKTEELGKSKGKRVLTDGVAYEVTQDPRDEHAEGHRHGGQIGCPAAGKTGTTDESNDAWFVGYTPELSTAVWVGYPNARIAMPGAQGGTFPAPVWCAYMSPPTATTAATSRSPRARRVLALLRQVRDAPARPARATTTATRQRRHVDAATGGGEYDPRLYEQAPPDQPRRDAAGGGRAPSAARPGNADGGGNGNGPAQDRRTGLTAARVTPWASST